MAEYYNPSELEYNPETDIHTALGESLDRLGEIVKAPRKQIIPPGAFCPVPESDGAYRSRLLAIFRELTKPEPTKESNPPKWW